MIEAARNERMIKCVLKNFANDHGFERFAYLRAIGKDVKTVNNYPASWQSVYIDGHYSIIDPVVTEAGRRETVFSWTADNWPAHGFSAARRFRDEAIDHGIRSGVTIPAVGTFGARLMLTFASSRDSANVAALFTPQDAIQALLAIHYRLGSLPARAAPKHKRHLSPRESICIRWIAEGMWCHEIADLTHINPRTVQHHLDSARKKLEARTLPQLVSIAKDEGLL
ncbi:transcriptional regulator [Rhizobium sp. Root708]|nr:transcriptional regulator [Rhizobium sp. Root708]